MSYQFGRRGFLRGLAYGGAGVSLSGMMSGCVSFGGAYEDLTELRCTPLQKVRVGVIGLGMRGPGAVHHYSGLPGVEVTALCDLLPERAERQRNWLVQKKKPEPKVYAGREDSWKELCDSEDVDLVHITTPWLLHAPQGIYALKAGKHAVSEVPCAVTLDECWELVETVEKTRRHFMMLENCCYGENEMLALSLCRNGVLGELFHGEAAYNHDLRFLQFANLKEGGYHDYWRLEYNAKHTGNPYPTHGLGPVCQYMDINRGDRFEYLTSVSSDEFGLRDYAARKFGPDSAEAKRKYALGDMNNTIIRTAKGRTILVQHDTSNARPYTRLNLIQGTKGILSDYPLRVALEPDAERWMDEKKLAELKEKYAHPLWKKNGKAAIEHGGHGGMDYLLLRRLVYCLQNGQPLDISVYDSVLWCSLVELTEKSVRKRGASVDVPDFTRGAWKTAQPLGLVDVG
ncbi:MAG: Gfo/Idh/MocA family oxidoreductase [Kiritimatiellae bacterium]|nr:Gfo/Idh/MocA family oxidoreductase [Kiritimatiellia bacterium]